MLYTYEHSTHVCIITYALFSTNKVLSFKVKIFIHVICLPIYDKGVDLAFIITSICINILHAKIINSSIPKNSINRQLYQ